MTEPGGFVGQHESGFVVGIVLGLAWIAEKLWNYSRRDDAVKGIVVVTPADVRERLDQVARQIERQITELSGQHEAFLTEERDVHPQIIRILIEVRTAVLEVDKQLSIIRDRRDRS